MEEDEYETGPPRPRCHHQRTLLSCAARAGRSARVGWHSSRIAAVVRVLKQHVHNCRMAEGGRHIERLQPVRWQQLRLASERRAAKEQRDNGSVPSSGRKCERAEGTTAAVHASALIGDRRARHRRERRSRIEEAQRGELSALFAACEQRRCERCLRGAAQRRHRLVLEISGAGAEQTHQDLSMAPRGSELQGSLTTLVAQVQRRLVSCEECRREHGVPRARRQMDGRVASAVSAGGVSTGSQEYSRRLHVPSKGGERQWCGAFAIGRVH